MVNFSKKNTLFYIILILCVISVLVIIYILFLSKYISNTTNIYNKETSDNGYIPTPIPIIDNETSDNGYIPPTPTPTPTPTPVPETNVLIKLNDPYATTKGYANYIELYSSLDDTSDISNLEAKDINNISVNFKEFYKIKKGEQYLRNGQLLTTPYSMYAVTFDQTKLSNITITGKNLTNWLIIAHGNSMEAMNNFPFRLTANDKQTVGLSNTQIVK